MGKKNLDDILIKTDSYLPKEDDPKPRLAKKTASRKKEKKESDTEVLGFRITKTEYETLVAKKDREAGKLVPLTTYFKDYLRTKTDLFK